MVLGQQSQRGPDRLRTAVLKEPLHAPHLTANLTTETMDPKELKFPPGISSLEEKTTDP